MGERDYENLYIIYRKCVEWCKKYKMPYTFTIDCGSFETAIEFTAIGYNHPPKSANWEESRSNGNVIKCPDLLDFEHRIIIELEEEGQKKLSGARLARKGHGPEGDTPNKRDTDRDRLYRIGGFRLLRFYETDLKEENWNKLYSFLSKCEKQH